MGRFSENSVSKTYKHIIITFLGIHKKNCSVRLHCQGHLDTSGNYTSLPDEVSTALSERYNQKYEQEAVYSKYVTFTASWFPVSSSIPLPSPPHQSLRNDGHLH